jgi:hypothetical protein
VGRSVDLNYLEPVQPNYGFRPGDDPQESAAVAPIDASDAAPVAVIDSPDSAAISYDTESNNLVDEDNGHGVFVASIIERYVSTVDLIGVQPGSIGANPSVLPSGRWSPMMFTDAELIVALGSATEATFVNLSLGGVGCADEGIGERLALARVMNNMRINSPSMRFVAAAGNDGLDLLHFPAAWRSRSVTLAFTNAVAGITDLVDPSQQPIDTAAIAADIEAMHVDLSPAIDAVGSIDDAGNTSPFSNCGDWVNAAAYGNLQVGEYPSASTGFAAWSGTSFATANFVAALVRSTVGPNAQTRDPDTGAHVTDGGLPCPPPD